MPLRVQVKVQALQDRGHIAGQAWVQSYAGLGADLGLFADGIEATDVGRGGQGG